MARLAYALAMAILLGLQGCGILHPGIPDADPPFKPPKPCEKIVIVQPNNVAVCMTKEEFNRYLDKLLRDCPPQCSSGGW